MHDDDLSIVAGRASDNGFAPHRQQNVPWINNVVVYHNTLWVDETALPKFGFQGIEMHNDVYKWDTTFLSVYISWGLYILRPLDSIYSYIPPLMTLLFTLDTIWNSLRSFEAIMGRDALSTQWGYILYGKWNNFFCHQSFWDGTLFSAQVPFPLIKLQSNFK